MIRKRKRPIAVESDSSHQKHHRIFDSDLSSSSTGRKYSNPDDPPDIHIQAFEADIIRNENLARLVEGDGGGVGASRRSERDGVERMIKLGEGWGNEGEDLWVDRYDARLLLTSPPPFVGTSAERSFQGDPMRTAKLDDTGALSDTGFSDLPSDHEEMFYFDDMEREEIAREKKRRKLEDEMKRRLEARQREDAISDVKDDAEQSAPSPAQLLLMSRLHGTLTASPSPNLLEIRILANHGSDPRFQFLRKGGKWRDIWERIRSGDLKVDEKGEVLREPEEKHEMQDDGATDGKKGDGGLLGALGGYGSDSGSEAGDDNRKDEETNESRSAVPVPDKSLDRNLDPDAEDLLLAPNDTTTGLSSAGASDERANAEKAARVADWARKRKEARLKEP